MRSGHWKRLALWLSIWILVLLAVTLFSVFLHEDGHGVGARIDGIHVSTGFNRVGNAGRAPGDADFRTGLSAGFWTGLLGPVTSWLLAIAFTVALYLMRGPGRASLAVAAFAVTNSLVRGLPMLNVAVNALFGRIVLEDEVNWSVWYVTQVCRPELASLDVTTLIQTRAPLLLSDRLFLAPVLFSLILSAICLALAIRRITRLWPVELGSWFARALFILASVGVWFASIPILNWLDSSIRINW